MHGLQQVYYFSSLRGTMSKQYLGVSRLMAANYLNKLADDKMLTKNRRGTGNYYINKELFALLTKR